MARGLGATIIGILDMIQRQGQIDQAKEEWKTKKEQLEIAIQERNDKLKIINSMPPEYRGAALLSPELGGKLLMLDAFSTKLLAGGGQQGTPEPPPPSFEQTGEMFRPTQGMIESQPQYKPLPKQIAEGQLGYSKEDLRSGLIGQMFGVKPPTEVNRTMQVGRNIVQILNNGTSRPAVDSQGQPLIVPEKAVWAKMPIGNKVIEVAFNEEGKVIMQNGVPLTRDVVQDQPLLKNMQGPGGKPVTMQVPPGGLPPEGLPEAYKGERLDIIGPDKEQSTIILDPYTREPMGLPNSLTEQAPGAPSKPGEVPSIQTPSPMPPRGIPTKAKEIKPMDVRQKINQFNTALDSLEKYKKLLFNPDGSINRKNLATGTVTVPFTGGGKGLPRTKGREMRGYLFGAIDPIMREASGMMIKPEEEEKYYQRYGADYMMNDSQVINNWAVMTNYLKSQAGLLDPNKLWTPALQKRLDELSTVPKQGKSNLIHFGVGADDYYIPPEKVKKFMEEFPKARRLGP